jgi:outer membrane protein OmpA-like peptidoglycan-associated protein
MGYGEAKPVASNGTEEGRKLNRRTECLIYDMDALPKEQLEYFAKLDTTNDDGFILDDLMAERKIGNKLNPQVHFLYNNGEFMTEFSKTQLAKVVVALKRVPKLTLELQGSTDVVGNEYNNKILYETRQHTVLQYFIENGIAPERLKLSPFIASESPKLPDLSQGDGEKRKVQFAVTTF